MASRVSTTGATVTHHLALQVEGLRVSYGPKVAVDGVSLDINEAEIFGLLGPNGAGKTSTLSAIEGLVKPDAGSIRVGDVDARANPAAAKARMGVQLQSTSFQSNLTIREIVRLYAGLYGVALTRAGIDDLLADVHLGEEASKRFSQLSGGQQKRVSLLIATIHSPPLVLLDEPTAGLDPQARRQLWDRIERLRDIGRSILLTTHSMEEAQAVCHRVAIIDNGKLLTVDTPTGLIEKHKDDPRVRKAVLRALLEADLTVQLRNGRALLLTFFPPLAVFYGLSTAKRGAQLGGAIVNVALALTLGIALIAILGYTASVARDRELGVFQRLRVTPAPTWAIMVSRLALQILSMLAMYGDF